MIVLLALLNDFPIMMIAFDNAAVAKKPVRWDMHRVLTVATLLGVINDVLKVQLVRLLDLRLPSQEAHLARAERKISL